VKGFSASLLVIETFFLPFLSKVTVVALQGGAARG
jgi:hypothetical protein